MPQYTYEKQKYELIPEGDYECVIDDIGVKTLNGGYEVLSIAFRIRADVEQDCLNRVVYETIWKEKEDPEHFNRKRINQLLGTQEIEEGKVFDSIDDIIKFLDGANVQCHIAVQFNEYRNADENRVKFFRSSNVVNGSLGNEEPNPTLAVDDDDIPF